MCRPQCPGTVAYRDVTYPGHESHHAPRESDTLNPLLGSGSRRIPSATALIDHFDVPTYQTDSVRGYDVGHNPRETAKSARLSRVATAWTDADVQALMGPRAGGRVKDGRTDGSRVPETGSALSRRAPLPLPL